MMEPVTVTVEGAKRALGLGHTKIYQLIEEGKLKTIKIGARRLILCDSIRAIAHGTPQPKVDRAYIAKIEETDDTKKYPLNLRTTARLRRLIEEAAAANRVSMVKEVEARLEETFAARCCSAWQAIKTAPKEPCETVLLYDPIGGVGEGQWTESHPKWGTGWRWNDPGWGGEPCAPSHWMPMPVGPA